MRVSASHAGRTHHSRAFCFRVEAFVRRASGRRSRLRCSGDLPPQRRTVSWPCLSWREKVQHAAAHCLVNYAPRNGARRWCFPKRSAERERRDELASRSQPGQRGLRKHPTYELPPLDGRLTRLRRCLCSDRRTKLPRLGRSESDMSMRASERPWRSLHPIASARD